MKKTHYKHTSRLQVHKTYLCWHHECKFLRLVLPNKPWLIDAGRSERIMLVRYQSTWFHWVTKLSSFLIDIARIPNLLEISWKKIVKNQFIRYFTEKRGEKFIPRGRSNVFDGVRTTGNDDLCLLPRRNPVLAVSTSDIIPGSSSNNGPWLTGAYPRTGGGCC